MQLERLPPNITGFFDKGEQPRSLDARTFKQACHLVAQMDGGIVERVEENLLGRSYLAATIRTTEYVSVLCNSVYPYLAFVSPNAFGHEFPELTFVKPTQLAATFASATEFQPLDVCWLNSDFSADLLSDLALSERGELSYWKPKRVGDVIFNSWD